MSLQTQQSIFKYRPHQGCLRTYRANVRTRAEKLLWEYSVVRDLGTVPTHSLCGGRDTMYRYDME
jgi:hypothetical protein